MFDPNELRRSAISNAAVAAIQEPATMVTTSDALARAFGIVLRQISNLIGYLPDVISNFMTYVEVVEFRVCLNVILVYKITVTKYLMIFISITTHFGIDFNSYGLNRSQIAIR